ncbi:MAG: hypothetical protein AB1416_07125 [Actinomycetota bacterium]
MARLLARLTALAAAIASAAVPGAATAAAPTDTGLRPVDDPPRVLVIASQRTERGRHGSVERAEIMAAELERLGVGTRVAGDEALTSPVALHAADVLVLPYVACMTIPARQSVAAFARRGGGVIFAYFGGRDDERCVPLVGQGTERRYLGRSHYGGNTEWADLSPLMGAWFLNDVEQERATFRVSTASPAGARIAHYAAGRLSDIEMWRPTMLWTELVQLHRAPAGEVLTTPLSQTARPLVVYRSAVGAKDARARRGAVVAWTNTYGAGRTAYLGFDIMDLWHPWASRFSNGAPAALTADAVMLGLVDWARGGARTDARPGA